MITCAEYSSILTIKLIASKFYVLLKLWIECVVKENHSEKFKFPMLGHSDNLITNTIQADFPWHYYSQVDVSTSSEIQVHNYDKQISKRTS